MRQKINSQLLNQAQLYAKNKNHPILKELYGHSYTLIHEILSPINRKFKNICIHGNYPEFMIPQMKDHFADKYSLHAHSRIT